MPAISGATKALMYSRAGLLRAGAGRAGYYQPIVYITIGGTRWEHRIDEATLEVVQSLDEQPDTVRLEAIALLPSTFRPRSGQSIVIGLGAVDHRLFAGHILTSDIAFETQYSTRARVALDCIDYTWLIGHKRCRGRQYLATSAGQVVQNLVDEYAEGFTVRAEFGLPVVDFEIDHEEPLPSAFTRLAEMVNAHWYVDANRCVHFYVTEETTGNPVTVGDGDTDVWGLSYREDGSQVRNRAFVTGKGTTTTAAADVGDTTVSVKDTSMFGDSGGRARVGLNEITYTGRSTTDGEGDLTGVPDSGDYSIRYRADNGASIALLTVSEDATAQSDMATLLGEGDGIIDHTLKDGRHLGGLKVDVQRGLTIDTAQAVGDADLENYSATSEESFGFTTRRPTVRAGQSVTVTLTTPVAVSTTLLIQRVTINGFTIGQKNGVATRFPLRRVEAGKTTRDLLSVVTQGAL